MPRLELKHPRAIRWFHWINVALLLLMIWSGLLIYWANDVYRIKVGGWTLIRFFPGWFYDVLHLKYRLAEGMAWHFFGMWFFALNGLLYVGYAVWSREWRHLVPGRRSFREAYHVILHDLHLRQAEPPRRKFNGAQQIAYTGVVAMGAGSLITGLAIYKPVQFAWLTWMCGGYNGARLLHFVLMLGYTLFFCIHVVQVLRAGWNNFRAMVCGYEIVSDEEPANEPRAV